MNRRGDDETLEFVAERFMLSILAPRGAAAFGPKSKMSRAAVFEVLNRDRRITMAIRPLR
jgi:hypothetical protein